MDWMQILDRYGIAVAGAVMMAIYIWKNTKYIQDDLTKDLNDKFNGIHNVVDKDLRIILIKLIDQQKTMQLDLKKMGTSYRVLAETIARLSGNGLRNKMMRELERDDL